MRTEATRMEKDLGGHQPPKTCQDSRVYMDLCGALWWKERQRAEVALPSCNYHRQQQLLQLSSTAPVPQFTAHQGEPTKSGFPKWETHPLTPGSWECPKRTRKESPNKTCQPKILLQGKEARCREAKQLTVSVSGFKRPVMPKVGWSISAYLLPLLHNTAKY